MSTNRIAILGVMTGTSCDALDASCISIGIGQQGHPTWQPLWSSSAAYPKDLRARVMALQEQLFQSKSENAKAGMKDYQSWLELDRDLGIWYGNTLLQMIRKSSAAPDLIANHGQTVAHFPNLRPNGTTSQLGDPAQIAWITGVSVASHFRQGDMAAGGEGAPLVPLFHRSLVRHLGEVPEGISIHNLGGISNLTYLGPRTRSRDLILAFDTGPANVLIDLTTSWITRGKKQIDVGGEFAKKGTPDHKFVAQILKKHPFFKKSPPKSTGRDDFPLELFPPAMLKARSPDLVATATELTAESIAIAYRTWIERKKLPLKKIYFAGGGAQNPSLMSALSSKLGAERIGDLEREGIDTQFVESQAFAFLAFLSLLGQPLGGSWTGASSKRAAPPAWFTPGANWTPLLTKLWSLSK